MRRQGDREREKKRGRGRERKQKKKTVQGVGPRKPNFLEGVATRFLEVLQSMKRISSHFFYRKEGGRV